ncbi:EthD domain-containing protein [Aspergillus ibericus CBS 121593]|uniref:EthD domain-containing protein n=1 Tax=Aspergillus ibericus CBS 121593 TaxID=1448316 RepID=A0A395GMY2_9EURO|nr:hypothetical protein BO80DRAFT_429909 [Aspergillus ibericus CBS 121593]RAK95373.1 hypothetical protein BO80DRAFT_429909 [Aspergillus ibericus CBS 121593]
MPYRILLLAHRKPTLTPTTFHTYYEAHIELLRHLTGDAFPLSHRRSYIARTTSTSTSPSSTSSSAPSSNEINATHPATILIGNQTTFPFDAIAELTFEDRDAFERFTARVQEPENARLIGEDEALWSDTGRLGIVVLGEVVVTGR